MLRFVLSALLISSVGAVQSATTPEVHSRPPILGTLDKGKYSNPMIGFELQLDAACVFVKEDQAIAWSTQFPQRLNLSIACGDDILLLSSFPLHADEKLDLKRDAQVSVEGVMAGARSNAGVIGNATPPGEPKCWCRNSLGRATRAGNLVSITHSWSAEDMYRCYRLDQRQTESP